MMASLTGQARQHLKEFKYAPVEKIVHSLLPANRQADLVRRYHRWKRSFRPALERRLREILARHPDPRAVIVFTPSLDWKRQLFQRPQQMAQALARQGAVVFYTQLKPPRRNTAIDPLADRLYLCSLPFEQFSILDRFYVYSLTWNRKYLLKFDQPLILYDYVDNLSTFKGDAVQLAKDHRALLREACVVLTTARQLFEEVGPLRPDALYVPNGVDFDHFHSGSASQTLPEEMAGLRERGKPVIGYYGAFASWFDYALMRELASQRAELNFVLIGPDHDGSLDKSGLLREGNIHYLGPKPYAELPAYLAGFDVAMVPFKVNPITQSTSPIKLFEYFAGGKPVVSTPLREVMQYREVFIGDDSHRFSEKIDQALTLRKTPGFAASLLEIARANTWDGRAEQILQALAQNEREKVE